MKDDTLVSRVHKMIQRRKLQNMYRLCKYCDLRKGDNARNCRTHGTRKPKYKDKR